MKVSDREIQKERMKEIGRERQRAEKGKRERERGIKIEKRERQI
jgi:hypothetical protein